MADLIRTGVTEQQMATNASLFGANILQSADNTIAYVMGPGGPLQFDGFSLDPDDILIPTAPGVHANCRSPVRYRV